MAVNPFSVILNIQKKTSINQGSYLKYLKIT